MSQQSPINIYNIFIVTYFYKHKKFVNDNAKNFFLILQMQKYVSVDLSSCEQTLEKCVN